AEKGAIEEAISTAPDFGLAGKVILR
ncbi:MAG: hypothetical protein RLZZ627_142, partial [Pseudomonadota bacterium]